MNPLTAAYGAASALRNIFFNRGLLSAHRLDRPVVSVGNLSVGGAGKTPFVIALGESLKARSVPFDVLSRGYGRSTRGVLIVDPHGSAADFGDEPLLIARRLQVPVVVGESRYQAGLVAERNFSSQLHILDDGFQHRSLARDFDIVLVTPNDFEDRLLPSGRLREPLSSLTRADAIVLSANSAANCSAAGHVALKGKSIWRMRRDVSLSTPPQKPVCFCGIARPEQYFTQLRASGVVPAAEVAFRDHHRYTDHDIAQLLDERNRCGGDGFITTEKDAINLGPLLAQLCPFTVATLNVILEDPADIADAILGRVGLGTPSS